MECKQDQIKNDCTCTYASCSKRGKCCECVAYHKNNGEIPGCFFPVDVERTYDRSIERFVKAFQPKR